MTFDNQNHNLQTLQELLISTDAYYDPEFRHNFKSLCATVLHLEDCLQGHDDDAE